MPAYIYGRHAVLEALRARRPVEQVLVAQGAHPRGTLDELLALAKSARVGVREVPRQELDRLAPRHQGVVAQVREFEYVEIDDLLAVARLRREPAFLLMLDSVQDPQNLGTLLRTAEAVGVHGIILAERRAVGVTPAVVKASAGAVEHLQVAQVTNLSRTIEELKRANIWVMGMENTPEAQEVSQADFTLPMALVLGSEGTGLSRLVRTKCDLVLRLRMWGHVDSLNVAVAGSIVLYLAKLKRLSSAGE
jgi:23S rRNA (guanosine2251-2'-O)-methyltransferase